MSKGTFTHRRAMAYISLFGLLWLTYGIIYGDMKDAAISAVGGLALAFGAVIAAYKASSTYDDHSDRCNHDK